MTEFDISKAKSLRIIIVDDDPLFTNQALASLDGSDFNVHIAGDGVEGLERIDAAPFDLAIIDLHMPRVDGLRVIALLRGAVRHSSLAIMVLSARSDPEAFHEAMAIGADAIETKPINWALLPDRVRSIVAKKRSNSVAAKG
ncbi:MAG: response regulator [Hyphomicrobiaceae bacterium]